VPQDVVARHHLTAGTADTMEVLANVELPLQHLQRIVRDHRGCLAWGGTASSRPPTMC
jgi:thymidine phosphorylase